jgi:hypothetical protein
MSLEIQIALGFGAIAIIALGLIAISLEKIAEAIDNYRKAAYPPERDPTYQETMETPRPG